MNPWILNDKGETTFNRRSNGHFFDKCRRCQQMNGRRCQRKSYSEKDKNGVQIITCRWCKKEKPCSDFEQYRNRKASRYHTTCDDCRLIYCKFCGYSFKTKCSGAFPPKACRAKECKQRSAVTPRSCSNASCIYHISKINPWILNDNGETTFHPRSRGQFSAQCRRCQQMSDVKKGT